LSKGKRAPAKQTLPTHFLLNAMATTIGGGTGGAAWA